MLEVVFAAEGIDEALHVQFDVKNEVVYRWSVLDNETQEIFGTEGEGTSIDLEEPFVIRFREIPNLLITSHSHLIFPGWAAMKTAGW